MFKKKKYSDWVGDNVVFEKQSGKQIATPQGSTHLGTNFNEKKAYLLKFFIILFFFIMIGRLFFLQIINGEYYFQLAKGNREKNIPIVAERGQIYDRNGKQLTQNIPNFSLAIIPHRLPRKKEDLNIIINRLAEITNKPKEEIERIIMDFASYRYESIIISENLDYETALSIQIAAADLPGIHIQRGSKRLYILDEKSMDTNKNKQKLMSMAHILGYESKLDKDELNRFYSQGYLPSDYIGKTGIEKSYENILRGTYGTTHLEVNAFGKEQSILSETPPIPGNHIKLTIDADMQNKLEEILIKTLKGSNKTRAAGIIINPNNGEILALVSLPAFDNNDFSGGIDAPTYNAYLENKDKPLFNRVISGTYPSGSTIKPAIAAAALQENIITPKTHFLSAGGINVESWFFPDWLPGGHGITDVRKSIAWSINTFYYYIGGGYKNFKGLGVDKIVEYLKLFGLNSKLGVDLPYESEGFLPTKKWKEETKKERWYIGDTYNVSIGQGDVLVTPLQIAELTSIIANRGTVYKPHVVKAIINALTRKEQEIKTSIIRENILLKENLQTVALGMKDCVDYGSCRGLSNLPMETAGKTGTAQWSNTKDPHAWFTVFAPFNKPQIVLTILIEEGESGSNAIIPAAEQFLNWWWVNKAQ